MNNVTVGGESRGRGKGEGWTYYETIGGGQGASRGSNGPSGVHVGMSNTRNTPIEVLEMEYPLRLTTYALRRGGGGAGGWGGGGGGNLGVGALGPPGASGRPGRPPAAAPGG